MPSALIYVSSFDGHRQVYVFVLSHLLNELKYRIYVAGNLKEKTTNSFYIEILKKDKSITFIDTSVYSQNGMDISAKEITELQHRCNIDVTIFAEADHHISLFTSQIFNGKLKLRGRTVGIFLRPYYFYQNFNLIDKLRFLRHLGATWRSDNLLFHELLLKHFRILDSALSIDENFVANHNYFKWLPDVFQQYAEGIVKDEDLSQLVWIDKLNEFKKMNSDKFIFLYFGASQKRRGYDLLLKFAVEHDGCFIHCGLNNDAETLDFDIQHLKAILNAKSAILETNQYISDSLCIEQFFRSATHLLLPYRNFFGSSGIMLQSLSYGIPVLVPSIGLMGFRVKKFNLGLTFNSTDKSMEEQFQRLKLTTKEQFSSSISNYMNYQSVSQLKMTLISALTGNSHIIENSIPIICKYD